MKDINEKETPPEKPKQAKSILIDLRSKIISKIEIWSRSNESLQFKHALNGPTECSSKLDKPIHNRERDYKNKVLDKVFAGAQSRKDREAINVFRYLVSNGDYPFMGICMEFLEGRLVIEAITLILVS